MIKIISIILVIVIIILSISTKNYVVQEKEPFYNMNSSWRDSYGVPNINYLSEDKVYISVIASTKLDIYVGNTSKNLLNTDINSTRVRSLRGGVVHFVEIPFYPERGDTLIFYNKSSIGLCYWAGHVYFRNNFYKTNKYNFKIIGIENRNIKRRKKSPTSGIYGFSSGFKRIGCYNDSTNKLLPNKHERLKDNYTFEECREDSYRYRSKYFALQNGGECYSGNDLNKAKSSRKSSEDLCSKDSWFNRNIKESNTKTGGNNLVNDIHTVEEGRPTIRYVGHNNGEWPSKELFIKADGVSFAKFNSGTFAIQPNIGGTQSIKNSKWGNNLSDRWIQYQLNLPITRGVSFCPDSDYVEHNPAGCLKSIRKETCMNSVNGNYKADLGQCFVKTNLYMYSNNNYRNMTFYKLCSDYFKSTIQINSPLTAYKGFFNETKERKYINIMKSRTNELIKKIINLCCLIFKNNDINFNIDVYKDDFYNQQKKSIALNNTTELCSLFVDTVNKSAIMSQQNKNGKNSQNTYLKKKIDEIIPEFAKTAKIVVVKTDSLITACKCENKTACGPC